MQKTQENKFTKQIEKCVKAGAVLVKEILCIDESGTQMELKALY